MKNLLQKTALGLCVFAVLTVNAQIKPVNNITSFKNEKPSAFKKANAKPTGLNANNFEKTEGTFPVNTYKKNTQIFPSGESVMGLPILSEDFGGGAIPAGWEVIDNTGGGTWQWKRKIQRYNYPFYSTTSKNGFIYVDSDSFGNGKIQDAEIITPSINCSGKPNIHLKFEDHLLQYGQSVGEVFVSTNKVSWNSVYVVGPLVPSEQGSPNPGKQDIDISSFAGNKSTVFIKFKYTAAYDYWWMVDDIKIEEILPYDSRMYQITGPSRQCVFSGNDTVKIKIINDGSQIMTGFDLAYSLDGAAQVIESPGLSVNSGDTASYAFIGLVDLSGQSSHTLAVEIKWPLEMNPQNDTLSTVIKEYQIDLATTDLLEEFKEGLPEGWVIQKNISNPDSASWFPAIFNGNLFMAYSPKFPLGEANDWMFGQCIFLEAGSKYNVGFSYWNQTGATNSLALWISAGQNDGSIDSPIIDQFQFSNDNQFKDTSVIFTAPSSGLYYLGVWCIGSGTPGKWVGIDNLHMYKALQNDIAITGVATPVSSCSFTNAEVFTVSLKNTGFEDITNFDLSYSINGGSTVTEPVTLTIPIGSTVNYSLNSTLDLSAQQTYTIRVFSSMAGDVRTDNDTLEFTVKSYITDIATDTLFNQFESTDDIEGWTILNNNNDDRSFHIDITNTGKGMVLYASPDINSDDWFFSSCVKLEAGQYYNLSFDYSTADKPHRLKISYGSSADVLGQTKVLNDLTNVMTAESVIKYSKNFTPATSGIYYIGFQDYSGIAAATPRWILIDNFMLTKANGNDIAVMEIKTPIDGICQFSNVEDLTVTVKNNGVFDINSFDFTYVLDDSITVTENIVRTITSDSVYSYVFDSKLDLTTKSSHIIKVYATLSGDENINNDTLETSITELVTYVTQDTLFEDFSNDLPDGWKIEDYDGVDSWKTTYTVGDYDVLLFYNKSGGTANDWIFTSCMYLEQGVDYASSFLYWTDNTPHSFSLNLLSSQDTLNIINPVMEQTDINSVSQIKPLKNNFVVLTSGIYYFGFKYSGTSIGDTAILAITYFSVYKTAPLDIGIVDIVSPITGSCFLSTSESISVKVLNDGASSFSDFTLSYIVDGGDIISELKTETLDPGMAPVEQIFNQTADLMAPGEHEIKVFATLSGDENHANDTVVFKVYSIHKDLESEEIHNNFDEYLDVMGWISEPKNIFNGPATWVWSQYEPKDNTYAGLTLTAKAGENVDAWYFSPCINMLGGKEYNISFYYKDDALQGNEFLLKISMGRNNDAVSMSKLIQDDVQVSSTSGFTKLTYSVTPDSSSDYYVGFHVLGNTDIITRHITLENIHLYIPAAPTAMFKDSVDQINQLVVYFTDKSTGGIDSWSWNYGDGSPVETEQNPIHLYPNLSPPTSYYVCLTVTNSLGQNTYCDSVTVTGTNSYYEPLQNNKSISYFPVPANSTLTIKITGENPNVNSIRILNLVGQVVSSAKVTTNSTYNLNTSDLPVGFYYLQIITDKEVINKKLMINR